MYVFLSYISSLMVIMISVFITLYFKSELERMFREKKTVIAFHVCNIFIILMITFATHAVTTIYIVGHEINIARHLFMLVLLILPLYLFGHLVFEKYKQMYRKYDVVENGKVLILNERYLRRK